MKGYRKEVLGRRLRIMREIREVKDVLDTVRSNVGCHVYLDCVERVLDAESKCSLLPDGLALKA